MQIGFVNFNTEEKKKVAKMMQMLQDSEAIEELGIGRVRDHFSNALFPGTSTLQHHAKYFAVLPSLYYFAAHNGPKFKSVHDVEEFIIKAEIQITRQLAEHKDGKAKVGITGIDTYKDALNDYRKYVKYDPTYIYGSGLATFGMVSNSSIYQLILDVSREYAENPHNKRNKKTEDLTEDADELTGREQLIICPEEKYDFFEGVSMSLAMSMNEAAFVKKRITDSCPKTLLTYLLNKENLELPDDINYYDLIELLADLNNDVRDIYNKSVLFSKLIHIIDWSFNYAYYKSFGILEHVNKSKTEFENLYQTHKGTLSNKREEYRALFEYTRVIDFLLTEFCENCYNSLITDGSNSLDLLAELVTRRERTVKRSRSKIGNEAYSKIERREPSYNEFRWSTVRTMVNEIRNPE